MQEKGMEGRRQGVVGLSGVVTPQKNDEGDSGHQPGGPASSDELRIHSKILRWGHAKVIEIFGADLRSLAAFRIVLAILVLADLTNRATDLSAHYTDAGIMPRAVLIEEVLSRWSFSLNLMNGSAFFQALLFGVAALAALALLVGYRTRLAIVIVWVLVLSIQWRNPLLSGAGEPFLRVLLFWGMFLPLGAYWSVDRVLKASSPRLSIRFISLATVGLFLQIAFVYWFTVAQRSGPEWRTDGTALYYALSLDQIVTPLGAYLYQFPEVLKVLTFATIGLEAFGPFLLFCPFLTGLVRTGAVLAFMSLHFGIWLTMDIGIFPWISAFCMVCFLPSWFWDRPAARFRAALLKQPNIARLLLPLRSRLSTIADVGQPFVAGTAEAYDHDRPENNGGGGSVSSPASSAAETPRQGEKTRFLHLRPLDRIVQRLVRATTDTTERETQYGVTARSTPAAILAERLQANKLRGSSNGALPASARTNTEPTTLRSSLMVNFLAAFFLLYVFCWNLTTVSSFTMPTPLVPIGPFLGIQQSWNMFAPSPAKDDGWYVIPGTLQDGQQVDLMSVTRNDFRLSEVSWEKPHDVAGIYKNEHWRKYLQLIRKEDNADQRLYFGRYICREWNTRHAGDEQLETFQITYMLEETLPDYQPSTPQEEVLWEHSCF